MQGGSLMLSQYDVTTSLLLTRHEQPVRWHAPNPTYMSAQVAKICSVCEAARQMQGFSLTELLYLESASIP